MNINNLFIPIEIWIEIICHLDTKSVEYFRQVCHITRSVFKERIKMLRKEFVRKAEHGLLQWEPVPVLGEDDLSVLFPRIPVWSISTIVLPFSPLRILYFGGESNGVVYSDDVLIYHVDDRVFEKVECTGDVPPAVGFAELELVVLEGRYQMFIFGGQSRTDASSWMFYNDVYFLDLETYVWTRVECGGDVPSPRIGNRTCLLNNKIYSFGGMCCQYGSVNYETHDTLHYLDLNTFTWVLLEPTGDRPPPLQSSTINLIDNNSFLLFAGSENVLHKQNHNGTYIYTIDSNSWERIHMENEENIPGRWCHHTMTLRNDLFLVLSGWASHLGSHGLPFDHYTICDINQKEWIKYPLEQPECGYPYPRLFFNSIQLPDRILITFGTNNSINQNPSDHFYYLK